MNQPSPPLLELWQTTAGPGLSGLAFGAETAPAVSRWQLDLPARGPAGQGQLAVLEKQYEAVEAALADIPNRLERLMDQGGAGQAFSVVPPAAPEAELLQGLAELRGETSFGLVQSSTLTRLGEQFQAGMQRLFQLLTHLAWVETRREGVLVGQTVVGWSGDTHTLWHSQAGLDQQALHRRNLKLALATRLTQLRLLVIAAEAAAKISLLMGSTAGVGGGVVLPLAWNYVNRILHELDQYQQAI